MLAKIGKNAKLKKVAITGGLSCGKSSVCHFLEEFGAYVVNADAIVHKVLTPQAPLGKEIIHLLGSSIVCNGLFDRRKIAEIVFSDQALLRSLENILHPEVGKEIEEQYDKLQAEGKAELFVAEVPLLFESTHMGLEGFFDFTIVVAAPDKICKQRFKETTGYPDEEYEKRIARQWPLEKKKTAADFVVENEGTLEQLKEQVRKIFNKLLKAG